MSSPPFSERFLVQLGKKTFEGWVKSYNRQLDDEKKAHHEEQAKLTRRDQRRERVSSTIHIVSDIFVQLLMSLGLNLEMPTPLERRPPLHPNLPRGPVCSLGPRPYV